MQLNFKKDQPKINLAEFIANSPAEMNLEVLAGENGLQTHEITSDRIQKLGLALAGFAHYIRPGRVQIVGQSEISYLNQLPTEKRIEAIRHLDLEQICCILITRNLEPPGELKQIAEEYNLPLIRTSMVSSNLIRVVSGFLSNVLAPQTSIHGVLMGMYGLGVLLLGESGVGKSECALDLITRGHGLISDDIVLIKKIGDKLEGTSPELTFEHLEIRGLGIINVRDLFGGSAIGKQRKTIDLCVELKKWEEVDEVERLGLETDECNVFGVKIPKFILPVSPGRTISTLVETAIRVHLLRLGGYDAAQKLIERHTKMLAEASE